MTAGNADADYCALEIRRYDPDRYLTALFAPVDRRGPLFALYALNVELARIRESVSEPMMGQIRLQWWRDAIAEAYVGAPRSHQVVALLARAIRRHDLSRGLFEAMLDARERDLRDEPPENLDDLAAYAGATAGNLCELALEVLGVRDENARRAGFLAGTAWALCGLVRAMPHYLRHGRVLLPAELEYQHQVDRQSMLALKHSDPLCRAVGEIVARAAICLRDARAVRANVGRSALPALLLAPMTESYLKQLARRDNNPFDPRLAVRPPGRILRVAAAMLLGRY